jgi:NADH:ubiquinone oxidoreductase subunit E
MTVSEAPGSADLAPALRILDEMAPVKSGDVIPLLQKLQDQYGYLPREVVLAVAQRAGLPASRIFGVATFYAQFRMERSGRYVIRCCRGTACHVKGSKAMLDTLKETLGVEEGGTTRDFRFTLEAVACLGTCFLAPVIMVNNDYYGQLSSSKLRPILEKYA